jgi:hypothetical protein
MIGSVSMTSGASFAARDPGGVVEDDGLRAI